MAADRERIFSGPNGLNYLHTGVMAVGMDADQPATGPQGPGQWCNDAPGAKADRRFGPVWLRGGDQVETGVAAARPWDDGIEQEAVIVAVKRQHHGALIDRHAAARADGGAPVL